MKELLNSNYPRKFAFILTLACSGCSNGLLRFEILTMECK